MVNVFLYAIHAIFFMYILYTRIKRESLSDGLLNAALMIIFFTVGYAIFDFITKFFMETEGFGKDFTRDTMNLVLLSIVEFFFYRFYFFGESNEDETGK